MLQQVKINQENENDLEDYPLTLIVRGLTVPALLTLGDLEGQEDYCFCLF